MKGLQIISPIEKGLVHPCLASVKPHIIIQLVGVAALAAKSFCSIFLLRLLFLFRCGVAASAAGWKPTQRLLLRVDLAFGFLEVKGRHSQVV